MSASSIRKLPSLVHNKFKAAQEAGDLTFYQTRVSVIQCQGLPFQLRFSPALASKPKSNKAPNSKPFNPFEKPSSGLLVSADLPSHNIVLNKFPVIPDHFILATKGYKEQTHLLEADDLGASYDCVRAYKENGGELFGFFNSGDHSGASQPHRHIQFLPVESMHSGIDADTQWSVLADQLVQDPRPVLPFKYFSSQIPDGATPEQLYSIYTALYKNAIDACQPANTGNEIDLNGVSLISYNLGFTGRAMVLCPRSSEGTQIQAKSGGLVGPVALNGTLLGGTLLVKSAEEWDALRGDETKLGYILQKIGFSPQA